MIYNTGTIAINGNTATGTGTNWTAPASKIRVGQTIIVLSNPVQMFQITTINSTTSLTVTPAASPALSGQKYGILVSDNLSVDGLAQSISQLINEYDENISAWEAFALTSANQTINVTINGTPVSIPALGKLVQKGVNGAVPVNQGGTGATTAKDARTNLGLVDSNGVVPVTLGGTGANNKEEARTNFGIKNSATRDVDDQLITSSVTPFSTAGVMVQCHKDYRALEGYALIESYPLGLCFGIQNGGSGWGTTGLVGMLTARGWSNQTAGGYVSFQLAMTSDGLKYRIGNGTTSGGSNSGFGAAQIIYSTQNTTKASDGTLKAASPVARIVKSREENQRKDIDENGFLWCGCGTANEEAEGISISRLDTGVYALTGSSGLASEGWQLLPPMDPGGMGELGIVEAEETENGGITIRLFRCRYMMTDDGEIVKTKGEPIDVPANSWIDVRLDMPETSIWNQKNAAPQNLSEAPDQDSQPDAQD